MKGQEIGLELMCKLIRVVCFALMDGLVILCCKFMVEQLESQVVRVVFYGKLLVMEL
uniref:Uncharacterized protein n=1 Tax=uncultured marine virus TaxID=186617 RepID=A0A0F7L8E4_9VIRU|nr:hypothetical protein [uncultured marine virus]